MSDLVWVKQKVCPFGLVAETDFGEYQLCWNHRYHADGTFFVQLFTKERKFIELYEGGSEIGAKAAASKDNAAREAIETDAQIIDHPKVKALVEALESVVENCRALDEDGTAAFAKAYDALTTIKAEGGDV